jgi:cytochrome c biogenesis protein CcdA
MKRIPNGALFQGTLIKGGRALTPFQRLAAAVMGMLIMFGGCYFVADSIGQFLRKATPTDVPMSLISGGFAALFIGLGFKITLNAFVAKPAAKQTLGLKKKHRV